MSRLTFLAVLPSLVLLAGLARPQGSVHVVEAPRTDRGAVQLIDVNTNGTLETRTEIGDDTPGLELHDRGLAGSAVAALGDLDGNGAVDFAVGVPGDPDFTPPALLILFRRPDGSLLGTRWIRSEDLPTPLGSPSFGWALATLGDLDADGSTELAVGNPAGGATGAGEVRILSLAPDGGVTGEVIVGSASGGFAGTLETGDRFGSALARLGDRNGDGIVDLAVGAQRDDDGGVASGALWLLHMDASATVASWVLISRTSGGLGSGLVDNDHFGASTCVVGDVDADGVLDLAVGAMNAAAAEGAVWILFMNADGTVRAKQEISRTEGGLSNSTYGRFGCAVAPLGDLDGDGTPDLAVGAETGLAGAVFVLYLAMDGTVAAQHVLEGSALGLASGDQLGSALATLGDLDFDGRLDLAAGSQRRDGYPHGDFTTLQDAVDAAASGDTILVRPKAPSSSYGPAIVDGKSLTIVGEEAGTLGLEDLTVRNLAASQTVSLVRLDLVLEASLSLSNADGTVWIEECVRGNQPPTIDRPIGAGLSVAGCGRVVVVRSSFEGGSRSEAPSYPGLEVSGGSTVHAYESTFTGGRGSSSLRSGQLECFDGGPAVETVSAADSVFLSGCTLQGGGGLYGSMPFFGTDCSAGGAGIAAVGPVTVLDSDVEGGPGGFDGTAPCNADGPSHTGSVAFLPGPSLAFSTGPLAREGENVVLEFRGPANVPVWLVGSPFARPEHRPTWRGTFLPGTPRADVFMGATNGAGELDVLVPLGLLAPGLDVRRVFLQPFMIEGARPGPGGKARTVPSRVTLGAGSAFLVLDASF